MSLGCSFTGHRTIEPAHREALPGLVARGVAYAYAQGCRDFYAGGAVGFDTVAEREVLAFRVSHPDVRLILLLPCPDQDALWDDVQRARYRHLLANADEVRYACESYTRSCMRKRNEQLAELCDMMLCYVGHARSGASQTMDMAIRLQKPVYNLYAALSHPERTAIY